MHLFTTTKLSLAVAAAVLAGVIVHDTKVDSLVRVAVLPVLAVSIEMSGQLLHGDAHTHVERVSVKDMANQSHQLYKRRNKLSKYLLQNNVPRGHHGFDSYNLPVVSY